MARQEDRLVTLTIDGIEVSVPAGTTILDAAAKAGIRIPTLCHDRRLFPYGACRVCVVQQKGRKNMIPACFNPVRNGMEILTRTPEVIEARRKQLQLILITHPLDCPVCDAGGQCELQNLVYEYGVAENPYRDKKADWPVDHVSPFIERNINRCILCGKCVRIDDEVIGANEISFLNRGFKTKIGTDFDRPMNCEFCGACISVCPVGALNDRLFLHKARPWDLQETETTCGYCGVGCTVLVGTRGGRILRVRSDSSRGTNDGILCVKGRFGWEYIHNPERLTSPLIRKEGKLVPASWSEALDQVVRNFTAIRTESGGSQLAGLCSPRLTNEELYLFQKLMRGALGTNHIDHAGGYSYAAHLAFHDSLGYAASTNSFQEIREADVVLALRCDLSQTHPVVKSEVVRAVKRNKAKLIVINSRNIHLNKFSALNLLVKPGSEVALINGMMQVILQEGLAQADWIAARTQGFESWKGSLSAFTPESVETLTGVSASSIVEAARLLAKASRAVILISTGQASAKQDRSLALSASNLALLTGHVGKKNSGVFLLGEKNNSQGALDMGVTPRFLPGYAELSDPAQRTRFAEAWQTPVPELPGMGALEILRAAGTGKIKGLYVVGENLVVTYPDSGQVQKSLAAVDFLVVQDCFLTETAAMAKVVLPSVTFVEKDGTFTNSERRVQRVRPVLQPLGQARPDFMIFYDLMKAWGVSAPASPQAVLEEISSLIELYSGIHVRRLDSGAGLQWPCPSPDHPGTPFLYEKEFRWGAGKFQIVGYEEEGSSPEYPFVLVTGPMLFHSGTLSTRSPGLMKLRPDSFVEIHPRDAETLGLKDQQEVGVASSRGQIRVRVLISHKTAPGILFIPYHFGRNGGHRLTGQDLGITRVKLQAL